MLAVTAPEATIIAALIAAVVGALTLIVRARQESATTKATNQERDVLVDTARLGLDLIGENDDLRHDLVACEERERECERRLRRERRTRRSR